MLTSPVGKSYIGQTIRPIEKRLEEHQKENSNCVAIYGAIQKYGWENFDKNWYECPDDDLDKHEELMVEVLGTLAPGGYNLREGGGSCGKLSEETKRKISESNTGKTPSEETRQKMSDAQRGEKNHNYGMPKSEETKQKMSEAQQGDKGYWYGTTLGDETRQKISEALIGITRSEETKQKMSEAQRGEKNYWYGKTGEKHPTSKKVYQYDLDGNFVRSFGSCEEAGRHLKKDGTNIGACARGKHKTAYDFKWSYVKY